MFYQTIKNKIMLKNIKRGKNSLFININIFNSTRYIFSNDITNLPKLLKTLKIKKKTKNRLKSKKIIKKKTKNRSFIPSKTQKKINSLKQYHDYVMFTKSSNRVADSTPSGTNSNEYRNKNIKIQKNIKIGHLYLKKSNLKYIC